MSALAEIHPDLLIAFEEDEKIREATERAAAIGNRAVNASDEFVRGLVYSGAREIRSETADAESFMDGSFDPHLHTRMTSDQRRDRALRLIHASKERS